MSTNIADAITNKRQVINVQGNAIDTARTLLATKMQANPVIESLTVNSNGTYTAPTGVDGYSPIIVSVPSGGGATIPNYNGLKEVRYFDLVVQPNATGYGIKAVGFRFNIAANTRYFIHGKNEAFNNPSVSSSWQAMGLLGFFWRSNAGGGRGAINFVTMSNSGTASYGATNSGFNVSQSSGYSDCTRAAVDGDATHQYLYSGTYRIYVFAYEKDYVGSVTFAPADSNMVYVLPDYASTCSIIYPTQ